MAYLQNGAIIAANTPEEEIRKEWDDLGVSCKDIDPKIDDFLTILNKGERNDE